MSSASKLLRQPPVSFPRIVAVPEYAADEELLVRYEAMKQTFRVPWMGVVGMAHAHFRRFYDKLWEGLEPVARSRPFLEACENMRADTERAVSFSLQVRKLTQRLLDAGYAVREIDEIKDLLEVFSRGNYPYLLLATYSRYLLAGGVLKNASETEVITSVPVLSASKLVLMEPHHADLPTQAIYTDIKETLNLPFVNTDYRALARWPSYFSMAWKDLKPVVRKPPHASLSQRLHESAVAAIRELPNPAALSSSALLIAAEADASVEQVRGMVELFQWLLPELAVNVAFFRAQLE
jgi:hypothetical protein